MSMVSTELRTRRAALWAAAVVWITALYFHPAAVDWNGGSRFALTRALAEGGTFTIDDYQLGSWGSSSKDKAFFEGHYYSDKSPVTSIAAAPVVWSYRQLALRFGAPFRHVYSLTVVIWLIVGGATAGLAALLAVLFIQRGLSPVRAAAAGVLWIGATPLLTYSFMFSDYLPACALIVASFLAAAPAWRGRKPPTPLRLLAAGTLCGLACWTLNTLGMAAFTLTALVVAGTLRREKIGKAMLQLLPWAAGGVVGAAGFFVYNFALFRTLRPAYAFEADEFLRRSMEYGFMGAGRPRPLVLWLQTVHPFQGIFLWFPAIALATVGCLWMIMRERDGTRLEAVMALATFGLFLTFSSAYYMWWGGWAYVPRHVIPGIALLAVGLIPWIKATRVAPWMWVGLAIAVLFNLTTAVTEPQFRFEDQGQFLQPRNALHARIPIVDMERVFWAEPSQWTLMNAGQGIGLNGPASILPLLGIWAVALIALPRWVKEPGHRSFERQAWWAIGSN